jgi:methylenetetrahydrofolate dehydrogenase (NADP+)/methenyltetrahydrofolate cyclohydrolase
MTTIIDGKKIALEIRTELKGKTLELISRKSISPGLALLLIGDNPASQVYVNMKAKACSELGYYSIIERLPDTTGEAEVLSLINQWNNDEKIHGILVQLPLPKQICEQKVIEAISPDKDVDGFHPVNVGKMLIGIPGLISCTPAGVMELFKRYKIELKGKHAVVVGRSNIVGKPLAALLVQKNPDANAIVTICHSATRNISYYTRQADILIAAIGVPKFIKADMVKEGVVIIDVGTNRIEAPDTQKGYILAGDVDYEGVFEKASAITPSPGGVGPMTIAMLMWNTYKSAAGINE